MGALQHEGLWRFAGRPLSLDEEVYGSPAATLADGGVNPLTGERW